MKFLLVLLFLYLTGTNCETPRPLYDYDFSLDPNKNFVKDDFWNNKDIIGMATTSPLNVPADYSNQMIETNKVPPKPHPHKPKVVLPTPASVASVRIYPSEIHKCSAAFFTRKNLLTTARCVYGHDPEELYIYTMSTHLDTEGSSYKVSAFITHSQFDLSPHIFDIAVVTLSKLAFDAKPLSLPTFQVNDPHGKVKINQWKFSPDLKHFSLVITQAYLLSNAKCTLILNEYIDYDSICAGEVNLSMGAFDEGMPLIFEESGKPLLLGLYNRAGLQRITMGEKFANVWPLVSWIKEAARNSSHGHVTKLDNDENILKKLNKFFRRSTRSDSSGPNDSV